MIFKTFHTDFLNSVKKKSFRLLVFSLLLLFFILIPDSLIKNISVSWKKTRFQEELISAKHELSSQTIFLSQDLASNPDSFVYHTTYYRSLFRDKGFFFHAYKNDSLYFWTSNRILSSESKIIANGIHYINNGWFYVNVLQQEELTIVGFAQIKNKYELNNDYLSEAFHPRYEMHHSVQINQEENKNNLPILNDDGKILCYINFSEDSSLPNWMSWLVILVFICSLLVFISLLQIWIHEGQKKLWRIIVAGLSLIGIFMLMSIFKKPSVLYVLDLFSPFTFATSPLLSSLGDLCLFVSIFIFFSYNLHQHIHLTSENIPFKKNKIIIITILGIIAYTLLYIFFVWQTNSLVLNSGISFEFYKISAIKSDSFWGLFSIALLLVSFILLLDKVLRIASPQIGFLKFIFINGIVLLVILLPAFIMEHEILYLSITFIIIVVAYSAIHYFVREYISISKIYACALLLSMITAFFLQSAIYKRQINDKVVIATRLASERDALAEFFLIDLNNKLLTDSLVQNCFDSRKINISKLHDYIRNKYFSGYWVNYDMTLTLCGMDDSLFIDDYDSRQNCQSFFNQMLHTSGIPLEKTSFYYLNDRNGIVSYLGVLNDTQKNNNTLYLSLNARTNSGEIGYPRLLLNYNQQQLSRYDYSYAKYYKGKLVYQSGDYHYPLNMPNYSLKEKEYDATVNGENHHLIYQFNNEEVIFISNTSNSIIDGLNMFSYIFVFFILLIAIFFSGRGLQLSFGWIKSSFRYRMLTAIVGISLTALISLGIILIVLLQLQFKERYKEQLREKINKAYYYLTETTEIGKWLDGEIVLSQQDIENILIQTSNLLYCDINLYHPNGQLFATSRSEVFTKELIAPIIHPEAFYKLHEEYVSEIVINEQIGDLSYNSVYTPLFNSSEKKLLYLNVPYFTHEEEYKGELSKLVISIINLSFILIMISIIVAFIISARITNPLLLIRNRIQHFKLAGTNELIEYESEDELGALVKSYNHMVEELTKNVELLARTERESAWREMARQVAHEIKNPLTPMKLSIQQLLRMTADKSDTENIKKTSNTLIEQIDNLSRIATEFSNFARMPSPHKESANLRNEIESVISLYSDKNIILTQHEDYTIYVDRDQLRRVFINLITNALQAIPSGLTECIEIVVECHEPKFVNIEVRDNGSGVSEDLLPKLFEPNFTTKTSGSGLGLAIIKNIIQNFGGSIHHQSNPKGGAIFSFTLPIK